MASELFTVLGVVAADADIQSGECFVLHSDIWQNPSDFLLSGAVTTIRLPRGTKMKVWDSKLTDWTVAGFAVDLVVLDDISGMITTGSGLFGTTSGQWVNVGQDVLAPTICCTYHQVQDARPQHLIESPDGNKYVAFVYGDALPPDTTATIQYTIEITDEVQG